MWDLKKCLLVIFILIKIITQNAVNSEINSMEYGFDSGMIKIVTNRADIIANATIKRMLRRKKNGECVFIVFY